MRTCQHFDFLAAEGFECTRFNIEGPCINRLNRYRANLCPLNKEYNMSILDQQVGGDHYKKQKIQPIEYIQANGLGFLQGCIVKRITRYKDKAEDEDIRKIIQEAKFILKFEYNYTEEQLKEL